MDASIIALIINLVLVLFLVFGLLWGLGRGFKKSLVRLAYLLVFVVIFALLSPVISSALLNINLPQSFVASIASGVEIPAEGMSITALLELLIVGTADSPTEIGRLCADNPALAELITKLPAVLVNLFVFVVLVFVAKFMSYVGFLITCAIHFKKDKKKKDKEYKEKQYAVVDGKPVIVEQGEPLKPKKHRLLGGLVGAVQGLVLMFCFFLPVTGFVNIAGQFIDTKSVQAETVYAESSSSEYEYIQKFIKENVDAEVIKYFAAYKDSIANKALSLGGIDQLCFDVISSTTVDGQKISIRHEINTVAKVTESILYVQDITSNEDFKFTDLDYDKLEKAITTLFDSGLIKSVGDQFLMTYLGYAISDEPTDNDLDKTIDDAINSTGYGDTIRRLLGAIYTNLESGKAMDTIKNDILALFDVGEAVIESGLIDDVVDLGKEYANHLIDETEYQERLIDIIISSLSATPQGGENNYLTMAFDGLLSSSTIQAVIVESINIGIDEMKAEIVENICEYNEDYKNASAQNVKEQIKNQIANTIVFDSVSTSSLDFEDLAISFGNIFSEMIDIYQFYETTSETNNLETNAEIKAFITSAGFKDMMASAGKIIDGFLNLEIFSDTVNEDNLLDQMYANYNKMYILDENDEPCQMTKFIDLTEFGVKNSSGKFNFGERFANVVYDMSQLMIEPLSVENMEDFDFKTFNYFGKEVAGQHVKGFIEVYDEIMQLPPMHAISTNIFNLIEKETAEEQTLNSKLVEDIKNVFVSVSENKSFADVRSEFTNLLSFASVLGECGMFDFVNISTEDGNDPEPMPVTAEMFNELFDNLASTKQGESETQAERAISYLFEGNLSKQLIISAINYYLLPELSEIENANNGLTLSYTGFDALEADAKVIANSIIKIWQNMEVADSSDIEEMFTDVEIAICKFINENFATPNTGSAAALGKILDRLVNSAVLTYDATPEITTDNATENIVEKLLKTFSEDGFRLYLEDALAPNAPANFWEVELTTIAPTLKLLNDIEYQLASSSLDSALMAIISGENALDVLDVIPENQIDQILDTLLTSSILKNFAVDIINTTNTTLIELIDGDATIADACTNEINLTVQQSTIKDVLKAAIACKDITDFETALKGEDKENVKTLLSALEANADYATGKQGVFYTAYYDYYAPYKTLIDGLDSEAFDATRTLLDAVLAGENITTEALNINATKLETIIGALIDCDLLKSYTVKVFNDINAKLITIIDESYTGTACDTTTNFVLQKESLLAVVATAQICKDITDINSLTSGQQALVDALILTLKANAETFGTSGVFYSAYNDYFKTYEQ